MSLNIHIHTHTLKEHTGTVDNTDRPIFSSVGLDEEESKINGIGQILNKIMEDKFPKLRKDIHIQIQEAHKTPSRKEKKETPHSIS